MTPVPLNARTDAILRRLVRRDATGSLRKVLNKARPEDVAAAMDHLTAAQQRFLYAQIADRELAASVLVCLSDDAVRNITNDMTEERIIDLLEHMEPDDATDVVEVLPAGLRERVIAEMQGDKEHADALDLLEWPPDSAGGIMSPVVFKMPDTASCGNAITTLQEHHEELESVFYVYVTDDRERLVGVVSMRQLLVHPPNTPLMSIMNNEVISVGPSQDQEEVARYVARYDLLALPVVDEQGRLMGMVTVDDVVDVIGDEAAEDMLLMAGVQHDMPDMLGGSAVGLARKRAGWLIANAFGGIVAATVYGFYEHRIDMAVLAAFVPVVTGIGGNVGIQSTTIAVRGLATGHVQLGGAAAFVGREARVGALLGLVYGPLVGFMGMFVPNGAPMLGLTVGLSVFIAIAIGSVLGAGLPVILERLKFDPAVATGPFVTTSVDVMGIVVYFTVALWILGPA